MQTLIKKIFAVILITLIVSCSLIPALAAGADIYASTTKLASLELGYEGTQSLSVTASGENKRLFVVRVGEGGTMATLYMYLNYREMGNTDTDEYGTFNLPNLVGHANGMAIDDNYIYITRRNTNGSNKSDILRIKRSYLWSRYNDKPNSIEKGDLELTPGKVDILTAEYSDGTTFNGAIHAITYYKDEKFIIKTTRTGDTLLNFTTAEVVGDKLVVSNSASDKFQVVFDTTNTHGQDIGYDPDCGLFIVTSDDNAPSNNIVWIKLNSRTGDNRVYTAENSKYRIIKVNKSSDIFTKYELESVSIGSDNHMYASVNTVVIGQGDEGGSDYPQYEPDAIIRIERPTAINGNTRFMGDTFAQ